MIECEKTKLFGPEDVPASRPDFQVVGAFNSGAIRHGNDVVLLARIAELPMESDVGAFLLPRYEPGGRCVVDRFPIGEVEPRDRRVVQITATGEARLTSVSHLRVVHCGEGRRVERFGPAIFPDAEHEEYGMEDPRITRIGERYYITYVAVSRHGAATALASTVDFETFERHGLIFPPENKDVVLFPEKIAGQFVALHRPVNSIPFTGPEMWVGRSPDLLHWGRHVPLYHGQMAWESGRVGAGTPPIRTDRGWLELYHGNMRPQRMGHVGAYCGGAMLLDADNPERIVSVAARPVLAPTESYELAGFVPEVVFPTGVVEFDSRLLVYYGAADAATAVAEIPWSQLWRAFE